MQDSKLDKLLLLNVEELRKWQVALRSGNYTQICQSLQVGNSYCCLGVLGCELPDTIAIMKNTHMMSSPNDINFNVLTYKARNYTGLPMWIVNVFTVLNDTYRYNFNKIADFIDLLIDKPRYIYTRYKLADNNNNRASRFINITFNNYLKRKAIHEYT